MKFMVSLVRPGATAEIDLGAFLHNLACARSLAPHSRLLAVIKADGYGHGLIETARAAAGKADALAVSNLSEAVCLRDHSITDPVVVFNALPGLDSLRCCDEYGLIPVIYEESVLSLFLENQFNHIAQCWLELDTGMHRLGLTEGQLAMALQALQHKSTVSELVVMTCLASADDPDTTTAKQQLAKLQRAATRSGVRLSAANSAALLQLPESALDWIRPGLMLYGCNPVTAQPENDLKPVMKLRSQLIKVQSVKKGAAVGYGGRWLAPSDGARIGILALGYADGYPLLLDGANTEAVIRGQRVPVIGRVSMDLCAVDLSACPGAAAGMQMTLWGEDGLYVEEVAARVNSHAWELLSGVGQRVTRSYPG